MKNTLLALQRTATQIDDVQQRLASGLRVATPLDNPSSYFTSQGLSSRAARLTTVLDGITSKISTIESANNSITSLQDLIDQAEGIAEDALETLTGTTQEASITGDRSLSAFSDLTAVAGIDNTDKLRFRFVDSDGSINSANSVTINTGDSASDLVNEINAITDSSATQVFEASLNGSGQLNIKTADNTRFEVEFESSAGAADSQLANALGFSDFDITASTDGTAKTRITVIAEPSLTSVSLYAVGGTTAQTSTVLRNLTDTSGGAAGDIFDGDSGDTLKIGINGLTGVSVTTDPTTDTVQDLLDGINNNGSLNTLVEASFDSSNGTLTIRAIDDSVESVQISLVEDGAAAGTAGKIDLQQLGFGTRVLQSGADGSGNTSSESILLGESAGDLANYEAEYNDLLDQIDTLVEDSEFEGVNLLAGDDMTIYFSDTNGDSLTSEGAQLNADGLGLSQANFSSSSTISDTQDEVDSAQNTLETFARGLANDTAVIDARQTYLEDTINTLNAGAEDLTLGDENEDSALLLALQTRQLLGTTGLALGVQTLQSTLRLF
ncbi:MAG: hypothetical protein L6Q57_00840 [Alphaproteobacteria bacterium]|nr:hypothetical protein [Alphaproteobacteria bacterium]